MSTPQYPNTAPPLVSIVTASLNMGRYIEETISSVLAQDYPNIEYIVMDAGSSDETLSILRKYEGKLSYTSERDNGTADAINKGFARAHGSILAFLNADDTYLPGAVSNAVRALSEYPDVAVVYGEGDWINERHEIIGRYPPQAFDKRLLERECIICQPTSFFRRKAFDAVGGMNPKLHYTFDYDLWIRMARRFELRKIDALMATSRLHSTNKTMGHPLPNVKESIGLLHQHFRYVPLFWVWLYSSLLLREKYEHPFYQGWPSLPSYCLSLPIGVAINRRHPIRFMREWSRVLPDNALTRPLRRKAATWRVASDSNDNDPG